MARYKGPTTRVNRRFGQAIFSPNKAFERKPYLPGQHGPRLRRRVTDYSVGFLEKQKVRFIYDLMEAQLYRTFERAKKQRGVTGEQFLILLETRLDSIVYLSGLAKTRRAARQFVTHGHIKVNGRKLNIPSYNCKPRDKIEVCERTSSRQLATQSLELAQYRRTCPWISSQAGSLIAVVDRFPARDEIEQSINEQLIVEFYSR
jgi:small subunit ribosomal protein S4